MLKKILYIKRNVALYFAVFIFVFISVIYIKFPNDRLKTWITSEIITNSKFNNVKIDSIRMRPFLTLELKGIMLQKNKDHNIIIDKAILQPSVLSLLTANISVPFNMSMNEGRIFGDLVFSKKSNKIESLKLDIEHIDFNKLSKFYSPSISDKVTLRGYLFGSLNVNEKYEGYFRFDIDALDISDISIGKMKLPEVPDLKTTMKGKLLGNNTLVEELSFVNNDISLKINGSIPPLWKLWRGNIDLYYKLQVKTNRYAYIKSFLTKDEEGNHAGKIGGTLGNPDFVDSSKHIGNKSTKMEQRLDKTNLFKAQEKLSL